VRLAAIPAPSVGQRPRQRPGQRVRHHAPTTSRVVVRFCPRVVRPCSKMLICASEQVSAARVGQRRARGQRGIGPAGQGEPEERDPHRRERQPEVEEGVEVEPGQPGVREVEEVREIHRVGVVEGGAEEVRPIEGAIERRGEELGYEDIIIARRHVGPGRGDDPRDVRDRQQRQQRDKGEDHRANECGGTALRVVRYHRFPLMLCRLMLCRSAARAVIARTCAPTLQRAGSTETGLMRTTVDGNATGTITTESGRVNVVLLPRSMVVDPA
jgi:hypothetical protein